MVKLVDTLASGASSRKGLGVRVSPAALQIKDGDTIVLADYNLCRGGDSKGGGGIQDERNEVKRVLVAGETVLRHCFSGRENFSLKNYS